ncbi:helix-hairpin-helix domain-containing protein [Arthrobacter sp. zg-Y820]|uniref:helix-hairpin-helix domain-containing protein n=1 Tax=unclassified Arthrobacter TaxID=235627 RepID=UPI001E61B0EC|nr:MULTISPECIES: helix-hairpin-helix domain-containing protein [unclassified Arthrobacter]MCC9196468.1 helix-hairpin-helix domain-containing protein [Arthrobacter sp. zg-Y820]MDK1279330.1 helix-hairpin-helix domain-containing protein [Arthrobacter sp. zg.Y820]WIB08282.1 helix-hairpin-helix domain-containing protein [Arthrobacter sp. zg-Y820]
MAEHRWDTAPSAPRLSASWLTDDHPDEAGKAPKTPGISEASDGIGTGPGVPSGPPRRWLLSFRAAVLAVCLLIGVATGLAVFKGGGTPAEISSVELDLDGSDPDGSDGDGAADSSGSGSGAEDQTSGTEDQGQNQAHGQNQEDEQGSGADVGTRSDPANGAPGQSPVPSVLVIHVAGAVTHPGVVRVPSGSRTADAVDAAGGVMPEADLTAVNLAAPLQDGMMVVVPRVGEAAVPPPQEPASGADAGTGTGGSGTGSGSAAGGGAGLLNINTASLQELDSLPRVGPVIAERIIAWREDHGSFSRPEDIDAVPGIGEAMLAALLPLITV